ncbi:hypothetical protein JQ617_03355 [Bradyrhizobium sp. KB893862 SZCCT0404]|uniref:hypothetical protein n=1 Tax=Bradyrhizobium sp. KB893862 SZCCT0404 TaxID=2807672 RepID=UPI001BA8A35A|nr:hypothetical protein [Bradyrhizobium sp. KB893862 SZCCT0404]MBR1172982.1 hypothetical protein [Bradyrhizobium sp. KB893862 SZCCT0404]
MTSKGKAPESWVCVDCNVNTAPGLWTREQIDRAFGLDGSAAIRTATHDKVDQYFDDRSEVYMVTARVWAKAGMSSMGGCLCVGCLETRIGRTLRPRDFMKHELNTVLGSARLLSRRSRPCSEKQLYRERRAAPPATPIKSAKGDRNADPGKERQMPAAE